MELTENHACIHGGKTVAEECGIAKDVFPHVVFHNTRGSLRGVRTRTCGKCGAIVPAELRRQHHTLCQERVTNWGNGAEDTHYKGIPKTANVFSETVPHVSLKINEKVT
uniref:Uncharacterized protein n=1 Tax=Branchiostoma floridae TaxID=7739 RepID=C3ZSR7_BRAFL|eukprot:XP_002588458.1 hypothetical protein BRAFLDRAFT_63407 [Branchiostoma floridae]